MARDTTDKTVVSRATIFFREENREPVTKGDRSQHQVCSTDLTDGKYADVNVFAPHYAGIPAHVMADLVAKFELDIEIPFETFN